jgi:hypothetical protein
VRRLWEKVMEEQQQQQQQQQEEEAGQREERAPSIRMMLGWSPRSASTCMSHPVSYAAYRQRVSYSEGYLYMHTPSCKMYTLNHSL